MTRSTSCKKFRQRALNATPLGTMIAHILSLPNNPISLNYMKIEMLLPTDASGMAIALVPPGVPYEKNKTLVFLGLLVGSIFGILLPDGYPCGASSR